MVFLQPEQFQIPTEWRRTVLRPQKVLCNISIMCRQYPLLSVVFDIPGVTGVLSNFETLKLLTERGTVSDTVLSGNTDLWRTS